MGGMRYPEEILDLDWDNDYYCLAYDAFQDYRKSFVKPADSIPYIGKKILKIRIQFTVLICCINHKKYQTQKVILYLMLTLTNIFHNQRELMKELSAILL